MARFFSDDFVERLRQSADIVRIVGDRLSLKKAGARYSGLCPFHREKTPSFFLSPDRGLFHCFGCGVGGDVFEFVKRYENVDFPEALALVAEKMGIPIPEPEKRSFAPKDGVDKSKLFEACEAAAVFFTQALFSEKGARARAYLKERDVHEDTVKALRLGFAPSGWDGLLGALHKKGFSDAALKAAGLIKQKESGGFYDTFRNRLIFPITNLSGKVSAFGGRALDADPAKYLNSPASPIYQKSRTLYGLSLARKAIREAGAVLVVEGYFDWLRVFQCGMRNVTATCGTALTEEQAELLSRQAPRIVLSYDGDDAGQKATRQALEKLLGTGLACFVLRLEGGLDPDTYIRQEGVDAYRKKLKAPVSAEDFIIDAACEGKNMRESRSKTEALNEIIPYLLRLPSPVERSEMLPKLMERLHIEDQVMMAELRQLLRKARPRIRGKARLHVPDAPMSYAEKLLLTAALNGEEACAYILGALPDEETKLLTGARIWEALRACRKSGGKIEFSSLFNFLPESEKSRLSKLALGEERVPELEEIEGALDSLRQKKYEQALKTLQKSICRAEESKDTEELMRLLAEKQRMLRKIRKNP